MTTKLRNQLRKQREQSLLKAVDFSQTLNREAIEHYGKFKCYIQITACHDATPEQLRFNDTPEVEVIGYAGMFQGVRGYDLKNVKTGAIYRNISLYSFFTQKK